MKKRVTRDIDPREARDLLERIPRASLAFASEHGPQALPIKLVWQDDRYLVGMIEKSEYLPYPGQEVVLLVDEGIYFFDLRAIYIRGQIKPVETPEVSAGGHIWFEVVPLKTVAWDYGMLREVQDEA